MGGGTTCAVIRREGMPGEAFPTLDHPPGCVLMGGNIRKSLVMAGKWYFPQLSHLYVSPTNGFHPIKPSFLWVRNNGPMAQGNGLDVQHGELQLYFQNTTGEFTIVVPCVN